MLHQVALLGDRGLTPAEAAANFLPQTAAALLAALAALPAVAALAVLVARTPAAEERPSRPGRSARRYRAGQRRASNSPAVVMP
ncbi:hypothetical protein QNO09_16910 [Streptomyces sp. 378]|uniref:hypothetical protein n=1 Tax=Streptomyces sp. 378 TaxID=3049412 RepID=UPI0024C45A77|nr:hypothetical protein [Streptomyces sp. 378]MDK1344950.1 hypothetical protein [Streptomyces sp. 378]